MQNLEIDVVMATLVYPAGAYILDKFLSNQKQIQEHYPASELLMATSEKKYAIELMNLLDSYHLKGTVISYSIEKPDYAKDRIWNITSGREAIRKHFLCRQTARYLLFLDSDMIFDTSIIQTMLKGMQGYGVVFSGYPLKNHGTGLAGCGCVMLNRDVLDKITFKCYEFKNGEVIFEDNVLEMGAYQAGARIRKGFFVGLKHYLSATEFKSESPHSTTIIQRITNNPLLRYFLIRLSIAAKFNIPWHLKRLLDK